MRKRFQTAVFSTIALAWSATCLFGEQGPGLILANGPVIGATGTEARLTVTGNSSPYTIHPVKNGLRLTSDIRENLTVTLHSISGKTLAVLFAGIVEPAISYDFSLADLNLGTGVYYCTLKSAKSTKTVRLVLTK
jgi:hypothetical protein